MSVSVGDRVRDTQRPDWHGTVLRVERYPGSGGVRWATVIWDWAMSPRRADLKGLEPLR